MNNRVLSWSICVGILVCGLPIACKKSEPAPPPPPPSSPASNQGSIVAVTPAPGTPGTAAVTPNPGPPGQAQASVALSVYRKTAQGGQVRADAKYPFRTGDSIRFGVSSSQAGHLYLLMKGSSGQMGMLYPDKRIAAGTNAVEAGQEVIIPAEGWFSFDKAPGVETVFAFFSNSPNQMFFQTMESATGYGGGAPDSVAAASVQAQFQKQARDLTLVPDAGGSTNVNSNSQGGAAPGSYVMMGQGELVGTLKLTHE